MKETIDSKEILNRKLILEVRYAPNPKVIDVRGQLAQEIASLKVMPSPQWIVNEGQVIISDSLENNNFTKRCHIDINRLFFISNTNHTNESFFTSFEKVFNILSNHINIDIDRIGCRIIGTYKCKNNDYDKILDAFLKLFPQNFLINDFGPKDLNFQLVYSNGQYSIGPINKIDNWTKQHFPNDKIRIDGAGFGIDTDNYVVKSEQVPINKSQLRDVYLASLSVEKLLFDKLKGY